jgi:hypothetical protein
MRQVILMYSRKNLAGSDRKNNICIFFIVVFDILV